MGRRIGRQAVTVDQLSDIVELTKKGLYRGEIANHVGVSLQTVWKYQKEFDLI